jgi:hypothetical protein
MFGFLHKLAIGLISAIAAFTGAFHTVSQTPASAVVQATSTSPITKEALPTEKKKGLPATLSADEVNQIRGTSGSNPNTRCGLFDANCTYDAQQNSQVSNSQTQNIQTVMPPLQQQTTVISPQITSWTDLENQDFALANQKGWTSMTIPNEVGEKRYYRLEAGTWTRKANLAEAQQPYQAPPPPNTTPCNGKYWIACPSGQDFVCPASGNAVCRSPVAQPVAQPMVQTTQPPNLFAQAQISNTILCNGKYWNKCPFGQDFVCPASGDAVCRSSVVQPVVQSVVQPVAQTIQTSQQSGQTLNVTQIPSVVEEFNRLEVQYKSLGEQIDALRIEQANSSCSSFITGDALHKCQDLAQQVLVLVNQQGVIVGQESLLHGIVSPLPVVTNQSPANINCLWVDGGTVWSCSSSSLGGTTIRCLWTNGGTMWSCN